MAKVSQYDKEVIDFINKYSLERITESLNKIYEGRKKYQSCRQAFELRYGICNGNYPNLTDYDEIGKIMNLSSSRVGQMARKLFRSLSHPINTKQFRKFQVMEVEENTQVTTMDGNIVKVFYLNANGTITHK